MTASARQPLSTVVAFNDVELDVTLESPADPQGSPRLVLTASGGLPALRLPPLSPGGDPVEILEGQSLSLVLDKRLSLEAVVTLLPDIDDVVDAALPTPEWDAVLRPLMEAVEGATGVFRFSYPLDERAAAPRAEVEFLAGPSVPALDVFGMLAATVSAAGLTPAPAGGTTASDSIPLSDPLLTARPHSLKFHGELPEQGDPTMQVSASIGCSVLGETFDATAAFRVAGGEPEFSLLLGATDPIRIELPLPSVGALFEDLEQEIHDPQPLRNPPRGRRERPAS